MSDALTAARMISTTLAAYQFADIFSPAPAPNNGAVEIARLQALVQRLADYARYAEQQHNSLLAEAQRIDAERCRQINAQLDEIATLRRRIEDNRETTAGLYQGIDRLRDELRTMTCRKIDYAVKAEQLERRVAALETENAALRKASSSD